MIGHLFAQFAHTHQVLIYLIIFLGMFVEGEIILILSGVLVRSRGIDFFDTLLIAIIAVIFHDIGYWYIGRLLSKTKKKKFWFVNLEKLENFLKRFEKRSGLYIFISKFAWSMNRFVLLASGYFKTPIKKLLNYSIPVAVIWTTTFISLGYIFADKTAILKKDLKLFAISIAIFLIAIIIIENTFQKALKKEEKIDKTD